MLLDPPTSPSSAAPEGSSAPASSWGGKRPLLHGQHRPRPGEPEASSSLAAEQGLEVMWGTSEPSSSGGVTNAELPASAWRHSTASMSQSAWKPSPGASVQPPGLSDEGRELEFAYKADVDLRVAQKASPSPAGSPAEGSPDPHPATSARSSKAQFLLLVLAFQAGLA